jgi:hypothetical protein
MATVSGKLIGVEIGEMQPATVDIMLCGYGSRSPVSRSTSGDNGCFASVELLAVPASGTDNTFEVELIGNDVILPAGTYYTFTFRDENGDALQCNAYYFLDAGSYDLTNTDPFDPSLPPPPLPPRIISQLLIVVADGGAAEFPGNVYTAWQITLDHDVNGAYLIDIVPGNLYTFIIIQDAVGGHEFEFPTGPAPMGTRNVAEVNPEPNSTTIQTFVADENGLLWAIGPGMWS